MNLTTNMQLYSLAGETTAINNTIQDNTGSDFGFGFGFPLECKMFLQILVNFRVLVSVI